ncbi:MAG: exodeoxyribonuclease VII large subunit [Clostridia bacterium]|nr:exodeoxyribonuclease VII large subunit [Clostridia bacterium]
MDKLATVSQINAYIKNSFDTDGLLRDIWIEGEISNYKAHYSGHLYLTLKDEYSAIKAVMFKGNAASLDFIPENGMSVLAHGRISVFERDGAYQLYIDKMQPRGVGNLYAAFEELKKKLAREGLFDENSKKPIPQFPRTIGVITSASGAAVRDIINIATRRSKMCDIYVYPVLVQGTGAAADIANAISFFNKNKCADVLIVGRGGGSIEDLWAFNEETSVRAVAASEIPVISAVGHETDFTLCDFAADLRAPTPSAAAELAVPDTVELLGMLDSTASRLSTSFLSILNLKEQQLKKTEAEIGARRFLSGLEDKILELDQRYNALKKCEENLFKNLDLLLDRHAVSLDALSPMKVLKRGYSVTLDKNGNTLKDAKKTRKGDKVSVILNKGRLECTVDGIGEEK